ncbi:RskA family anti-sigma factor, partial [Nocardia wallacei]|uniref:RskA family anti-sigma factor n=1 Tax=Nocardia wallacei TaxID=480035 RepID=UPI0024548507
MHDLTAPYVLDALPDEERTAFEAHLRECPCCRREIGELGGTVARLAAAWAQPPSEELRGRGGGGRAGPPPPPGAPPPPPTPRPGRPPPPP